MKRIHMWECAVVLLVCSATVFAQDQANEIRCSGGSGCKSGFIPKFASNGGSATVNNSIVSQSGTTINVAGSQTVNGGLAVAGTASAGNFRTPGNITATGNVSANGSIGVSGNLTVDGSGGAAIASALTVGGNFTAKGTTNLFSNPIRFTDDGVSGDL